MTSKTTRPQSAHRFGPFLTEALLAEWAALWATENCPTGTWIELEGPLGAGKTATVRAILIGQGLPAEDYSGSPTYPILHEYAASPTFLVRHIDCYRLESRQELQDRGLEEAIFDVNYSVFVEWPERLGNDRQAFYRFRPGAWRLTLSLESDGARIVDVRNLLNRSGE